MFILILCSETPFSKNSYHIETSQPICKANKLTGFYMIQVFTKNDSQTDCTILLKMIYLAAQKAAQKNFVQTWAFSFKFKFTICNSL